jgi:hypothetical protein
MENIHFDPIKHSIMDNTQHQINNEPREMDIPDEEDSDFLNYDIEHEDYDYGNSGEKYGWYNGWSDDVIDDAFEGDPENTWNVD